MTPKKDTKKMRTGDKNVKMTNTSSKTSKKSPKVRTVRKRDGNNPVKIY